MYVQAHECTLAGFEKRHESVGGNPPPMGRKPRQFQKQS